MSENVMEGTIVDETVERTLVWAEAMKQWLQEHDEHIQSLCRDKQLPKPPQW